MEDIRSIKLDENENFNVIEINENQVIENVALKTLLKGEKGEPGETKIEDIKVNNVSVVDENKIANIDLVAYALKNDIPVNRLDLNTETYTELSTLENGVYIVTTRGKFKTKAGGSATLTVGIELIVGTYGGIRRATMQNSGSYYAFNDNSTSITATELLNRDDIATVIDGTASDLKLASSLAVKNYVENNKPQIQHTIAIKDATTGKYTSQMINTTLENIKTLAELSITDMIPLDLSENRSQNKLNVHEQLSDGVYFVTDSGYIDLISDTWRLEKGNILYMQSRGDEFTIIGMAGLLYYYWENGQYVGGYPITSADLDYALADYKHKWSMRQNHLPTNGIQLPADSFFRKYKETGVTKLSITYPAVIDYYYESLLTVRTASDFQTYTLVERNYPIFFYGLDCEDGVFIPQPNRQYSIHARADGFDGLYVDVIGGKYNEKI